MKLYFHSDDLGATLNVSEDIISCWKSGAINGFSILANGDALAYVADELRLDPERKARIAVHLNLSEGKSLINPKEVKVLVNEEGELKHTFGTLIRAWLFRSPSNRKRLLDQVEQEWRAQIKKVKQICYPRPISAIDGHMHVHMLPFFFPIAARLAKEFQIPSIRVSHEVFYLGRGIHEMPSPAFLVNVLKHCILRFCSFFSHVWVKRYGLEAPQRVTGVLHSGRMTAKSMISGIATAKRRKIRDLEIILHVGRAHSDELIRWRNSPFMAQFYSSIRRDIEREELIEYMKSARE